MSSGLDPQSIGFCWFFSWNLRLLVIPHTLLIGLLIVWAETTRKRNVNWQTRHQSQTGTALWRGIGFYSNERMNLQLNVPLVFLKNNDIFCWCGGEISHTEAVEDKLPKYAPCIEYSERSIFKATEVVSVFTSNPWPLETQGFTAQLWWLQNVRFQIM